ncbi:MAG: hypothetical protein KAS57_03255 [Gammaproteobacteria bacterium]|nr:hypothetical protein [Gammaproteobacteria bacterium]
MKIRNIVTILTAVGFAFATLTAEAVPSFARDTGKNCSYCHNAWPQLSKKGRVYKELGYRMPDGDRMSFKDLAEENSVGVSALIFARPYDKKDSAEAANTRALHEAEIVVAGAVGENWSGFFELEAEDEAQNAYGFEIGIPSAVLAYNHSKALNLQFTWGEMMRADPYGLFGLHFRMTRAGTGAMNQAFDGYDGSLNSRRQNLVLTGRPIDQLFYSVGISAQADSPAGSDSTDVSEGKDASTIHARVAFDVTKDIMIGGFMVNGQVAAHTCSAADIVDIDSDCNGGAVGEVVSSRPNQTASDAELEYTRIGLDAQADIGNTRVQLMFVSASDDGSAAQTGTENDNDAMSVQAYHVFKAASGAPTWVPLIRFDSYEKNNGADSYDELVLNVAYYFEQNIKGFVEFWDRSAQDSADDDDRLTVQLAVGF